MVLKTALRLLKPWLKTEGREPAHSAAPGSVPPSFSPPTPASDRLLLSCLCSPQRSLQGAGGIRATKCKLHPRRNSSFLPSLPAPGRTSHAFPLPSHYQRWRNPVLSGTWSPCRTGMALSATRVRRERGPRGLGVSTQGLLISVQPWLRLAGCKQAQPWTQPRPVTPACAAGIDR